MSNRYSLLNITAWKGRLKTVESLSHRTMFWRILSSIDLRNFCPTIDITVSWWLTDERRCFNGDLDIDVEQLYRVHRSSIMTLRCQRRFVLAGARSGAVCVISARWTVLVRCSHITAAIAVTWRPTTPTTDSRLVLLTASAAAAIATAPSCATSTTPRSVSQSGLVRLGTLHKTRRSQHSQESTHPRRQCFLVTRDLYRWPSDPKINEVPGLIVEHFYVKFGHPSCILSLYTHLTLPTIYSV